MISEETELLLHLAFMNAREQRCELIGVEQLLLMLATNEYLAEFWADFNIDVDMMQGYLDAHINNNIRHIPESEEVDTQPTLGFQRVIQRAILYAQSDNKPLVTLDLILLGIFAEKDSPASKLLISSGLTREKITKYFKKHPIHVNVKQANQDASLTNAIEKKEIEYFGNVTLTRTEATADSPKVFISYSHVDKACLDRLLVHLKPLNRSKSITYWSDRDIKAGEKWRVEIERNLNDAAIAILLISADFLASDFIVNNELPPLLLKADQQGIRILSVILKPCGFHRESVLSSFQAVNDPSSPLLGLTHIDQEDLYNKLADEVYEEVKRTK